MITSSSQRSIPTTVGLVVRIFPATARHGMAGERHGHGMAGERHGMCELAFTRQYNCRCGWKMV